MPFHKHNSSLYEKTLNLHQQNYFKKLFPIKEKIT